MLQEIGSFESDIEVGNLKRCSLAKEGDGNVFSISLLYCAVMLTPARVPARFAEDERAHIVSFWNAQGRYRVGMPLDAPKKGVWQIRLTPAGSLWLWKYQNALGLGKTAPTTDFTLTATQNEEWKQWVQRKVESDRWKAQQTADAANLALLPQAPPASPPPSKPIPADPGPIPPALLNMVGNPPPFANTITPLQHSITFEDGEVLTYVDNVLVSNPRYAYYRFPQGVVSYGTSLKKISDSELNPIFEQAGFSASELKVAKAVSRLEGGFESVNTYDTGYVSVGFLQFITFDAGKGSLVQVLQQEKSDRPQDFERDFRQYGIDITPEGVLTVIDPGTGAELVGAEAVMKVVDDKRLTAVFQRAGKHSVAFRVAQVKVARLVYWPTNDLVKVTLNGQQTLAKVSELVKSEAGLATLFDRKVNRGNIEPITDVVSKIVTKYRLTTLAQLPHYEREIVQGLKYREDFLADKSLAQPPDVKALPPPPVEVKPKPVEPKPKDPKPVEPKPTDPNPLETPAEEPDFAQLLRAYEPNVSDILFPLTHL